jgi:hypothetical protein
MRDLQDTKFNEMVTANPDAANDIFAVHQNLGTLAPDHLAEGFDKFSENAGSIMKAIKTARANNFGRAGQLGKISANGLDPYADDSYLPGGANFAGDAKRMGQSDVAAAQKMANDIDNNPPAEGAPDLRGRGMDIAKRHYKMLGYDTSALGA